MLRKHLENIKFLYLPLIFTLTLFFSLALFNTKRHVLKVF